MENILIMKKKLVVFTLDSTVHSWWKSILLKKPYWHVFLIDVEVIDNNRHFITIHDPVNIYLKWYIKLETRTFEVVHWYSYILKYVELCISMKEIKPVIVEYTKISLDKYNFIHKVLHKLPFCNVLLAKMLGFATYAITPYQFYKHLKRKGNVNLV